jgi:hypothetical protein
MLYLYILHVLGRLERTVRRCSYAVRVMSLWMKSEKRTFHTKHAYQISATHGVELHSKQYDLTRLINNPRFDSLLLSYKSL